MTHPVDQISAVMLSAVGGRHDTQTRYLTDIGGVVRRSKDQLWRSVVPRTDIADIGLSRNQDLGRTKVTQFENARGGV